MIALIIISLLALSLAPTFQTYFEHNRLRGAAETLYDNILLARSEAIATATATQLVFSSGTTWCYGLSNNNACDCNNPATCTIGTHAHTDYPNTVLTTTTNTLTFNETRGIPDNTATITFSNTANNTTISVMINALGIPKICSSTVGDYSAC